jgi:uncharacterized OB-fold protein
MQAPPRRLPLLEPATAFFWTSGADGKLRIQRCACCQRYQHPPWPRCASCGSEDIAPEIVSGRGKVATYTINYQAWMPGLPVPYTFAAVELQEQAELYILTNVLGPVEDVRIGMNVTVSFEHHEDVFLPVFLPAEADNG